MARIVDEPVLVLHTRPYRNTSLVLELLTLHHGRVAAVRRGARGARNGNALQAFCTFRAGLYGTGTMLTLTSVDDLSNPWLQGDRAAGAHYVAELIIRLIGEREPVPAIFGAACVALQGLQDGRLAPALREFERTLLDVLGYGIDFLHEARGGAPIEADALYRFVDTEGFVPAVESQRDPEWTFTGATLLAIDAHSYERPDVIRAAKRVMQRALQPHLGSRPLISRSLLRTGRIGPQPLGTGQ